MARPAALVAAYRAARYRVLARPAFVLRAGRPSAALRRLLGAGAATACVITACNPGSRRRGAAANRAANTRLRAALKGAAAVLPARAEDPRGAWPVEAGFLALGLTRARALALGRRFGQRALLWAGRRGRPRLLWVE